MSAIKVNADYESVLFGEKQGSSKLNETIEFLAFFLQTKPVFTQKKYSSEYLDTISQITGHKPETSHSGASESWWGPLENIEKERFLNSKMTSSSLLIKNSWIQNLSILQTSGVLPEFPGSLLLKNPYEMSGRGLKVFSESQRTDAQIWLKENHQGKPWIIEPLLERLFDFSHYIFSDGATICYENVVDRNFQYKGTLFRNWTKPSLESLSFWDKVPRSAWSEFLERLAMIKDYYLNHIQGLNPEFGFSVDSFIYQDHETINIHPMTEVNYRRTMGCLAYGLSQKFGQECPWTLFLLGKSLKAQGGFSFMQKKLAHLLYTKESKRGVIILSPGDARFEMIFLLAPDADQGKILLNEVKSLLPNCQFSIEL